MKNRLATFLILLLAFSSLRAAQPAWVYYNTNHFLVYSNNSLGDHVMDFSSAGYEGGGVAIPTNEVVQTNLNAIAGDSTASIQDAINYVSGLTPNANGFRGVVVLNPGTFYVSSQINVNTSGVVVRGSGSGTGGTLIVMTNASPFTLFNLSGSGSPSQSGKVNITDAYVPSGATTFHVSSTSGYSVGDTVLIGRTVTTNWIHYLGMDNLVSGGVTQTWISAGTVITTDRQIQQISGNQITVDAPLTDSFDTNYLGTPAGTMSAYTWSGRISQVGLEHLAIQGPPTNAAYTSVNMNDLIDSWARDIAIQDGVNCFTLQNSTKRVTVDNVSITHTITITGDPPADFTCTGTQILINQGRTYGTGVWPFVTQGNGCGPIVALNFYTSEDGGISPHQRWTTGVLADGGSLPNAPSQTQGIAYRNRGTDGSGQGWATGWSVAWNVVTPYFLISAAAGTENWCIGGIGAETTDSDPNGIYDALGSIVTPTSLYLEQLRERLGGAAVENTGYPLFTISATPPSQTMVAGGNTTFTVSIGDPTLMSNIVALSVSGLPSGAAASFNTNAVTGAGNAVLTVTASNSVAPGTYTLNVIGTNGGLAHTNSVNLTVGNFGLSVSPSAQTVSVGVTNISYTVTVATNSGFSGSVAFGLSGLPANSSAGFSPGSLNGAGTATLSVTNSNNTPGGTYLLTIAGTNGNSVASATASLTVVGFPGEVLTWNGGSATDNNWSDGANWSGGGIASNDFLFFGGTARLNNTNDTAADTTYSNLVFNAGAGAFVLGGNPIALAGNVSNNSTNPQTIDLGLNFGGNGTNITFIGGSSAAAPLIIGGGLTNTFGAPGYTTLTLAGYGILTNLLNSSTSPGGTNVIEMNNNSANWTLADNGSSSTITQPWGLVIFGGTFNFGTAGDTAGPNLVSTPGNASLAGDDTFVGDGIGLTGTFNMVNGSLTLYARLDTGTSVSGSTGIVNQMGGNLTVHGQFQGANIGGGVSTLSLSGGTFTVVGNTTFVASRGTGTFTVGGSAVANLGLLDVSRGIGLPTVGVVNLNTGGTLVASEISTATQNAASPVTGASANFNFDGGLLEASGSNTSFITNSSEGVVTIPLTVTVKSGGAIINNAGYAITVTPPLISGASPDGGLTSLGAGTLTLTAVNTYNGNTTIGNGTLALSGAGAISNSITIAVEAGATLNAGGRSDGTLTLTTGQTLTGNGSVKGNVIVGSGATLTTGNSPGILTFSNNLTLNSGSLTALAVNKSVTPSNAVAKVTGTVTYGGTLVITNTGPIPFSAGDSFKLFSAAGYSGAFTNLVPAIPEINLAWNTNGLAGGVLSVISSPTTPPKFGTARLTAGSNFILSGTGGVPDWTYYVLASTNVGLPTSQWPVIATNTFDGNGNFIFTNSAASGGSQSFYLLKLQ